MRASARKEKCNKVVRSKVKTEIKKAEIEVAKSNQPTQETVKSAQSALDKAASKGIIHPNTAARKKSRLLKKLQTSANQK
jgi:small subunit ribosomal protein S20